MGLKAAYLLVIKKFPKEPYGQCTSGFIVSRKKDDLVNEAKHLSNEFHFHSFFSFCQALFGTCGTLHT